MAAVAMFLSLPVRGADGGLSLQIEAPASARVGEHVTLRLTAIASGTDGFYFKQPWKWAKDGLRVVAIGPDGVEHESTTEMYDIDGAYLCTFFKPLSRGDRFSFEAVVVLGRKPVLDPSSPPSLEVVEEAILPHLDLPPGRYRLRWVYEPKLYTDEGRCSVADVPIWAGHAESAVFELNVR